MKLRQKVWIAIGSLLVGGLLTLGAFFYLPLNFLSVQQKPEQPPQKIYDYYIIIDEATGQSLMYVPLVVSVGDEMLSEDNKRYRIIRVEENRAIARYVEDIDLDPYRSKPPPDADPEKK